MNNGQNQPAGQLPFIQTETESQFFQMMLIMECVHAVFCALFGIALIPAVRSGDPSVRDLFRVGLVYLIAVSAVLGVAVLFALLMYQRKKTTVTVQPQGVTIVTKRGFRSEETVQIPAQQVTYLSWRSEIFTVTADKKPYKIPHIRYGKQFTVAAASILRAAGANFPMTDFEEKAEMQALIRKWKDRRAERAYMRQIGILPEPGTELPPIPLPCMTTDENGQPILPQCLTAEQAEGVFSPAPHPDAKTEEQTDGRKSNL